MVSDEGALCTTRDDATEDDGRTRDDDDDEREDGQSQCVDIGVETKVPSAVGIEKQGATRTMRLNARGAVFSRTRCVSTRRVDAYGVLTSKKSRIARHDSTKKKPKNCAGR